MGLDKPLLPQHKLIEEQIQPVSKKGLQANFNFNDQQQKEIKIKNQKTKKIKFVIIFFAILLTSVQIYQITTLKLQHSRNFTRFLHYHLLQHTLRSIYWFGQDMINYPIQQFQTIQDFKVFLGQFNTKLQKFQDNVYGFIEFQKFLQKENKISLLLKNGQIKQYDYIINEGFVQPFDLNDINTIKNSVLASQQVQIILAPFNINQHQWNVMLSITTDSDTSIYVRLYSAQSVKLWKQHITTFIVGIALLIFLVYDYFEHSKTNIQNIPQYLLCVFLINTFIISLDEGLDAKWIVILDGIQCLISWLLLLKFYQRQDDYHISLLIKKSYLLVGRLFVSFLPIFIGVAMFAYCIFCRQAWQFSTFKRTFLTLFYISYYNATYESFVVTGRANPLSMIFFFSFVILFTICVYSGMLVAVFCSYVWNKRQSKIKQDIVNNLKIQCTECNYKYKYVDCLKQLKNPKKSLKMSFIMQIDFKNSDQKYQYKKILQKKLNNLSKKILQYMQINKKQLCKKRQRSQNIQNYKINEFQKIYNKIKEIKKDFNKIQKQMQINNQKQINNNSSQYDNNQYNKKNIKNQ